jgi:hypothetical protein
MEVIIALNVPLDTLTDDLSVIVDCIDIALEVIVLENAETDSSTVDLFSVYSTMYPSTASTIYLYLTHLRTVLDILNIVKPIIINYTIHATFGIIVTLI